MPKLQVNDDGTITIPLRGQPPVTIGEPSMADLAWLTEAVDRVDASLPQLPTLPTPAESATPEQMAAFTEAVNERTKAIYSGEMPYGTLLIETVKRFSGGGVVIDAEVLPSWAASPAVMRTMLETFRSPLPGAA